MHMKKLLFTITLALNALFFNAQNYNWAIAI